MCIKSFFRKGYDNLKFTALKVRYGDAFLLQKDGRNCLFDAGQYNDVINALANNNVEKIDLAICSHNDVDHADGFVKLFENKFPITEIWLPGFWASILQFVINNWNNKTIWFNVSRYADLNKNKSKESLKEIDPNTLYNGESEPVDKFHHELNDFVKTHEGINNIPWLDSETAKSIKLDKILIIAEKACNNDCDIHWFEPFNGCTDFKKPIAHNFLPLNSYKIAEVKKIGSEANFYHLLCLTIENELSLAFEYYYNDIPVIRFSADTKHHCQSDPYNHSIIITAPHHGSDENNIIYGELKTNPRKTIWVRTHKKQKPQPCDEFLKLKNKYCLKCYKEMVYHQISFNYNGKRWKKVEGNECNCHH